MIPLKDLQFTPATEPAMPGKRYLLAVILVVSVLLVQPLRATQTTKSADPSRKPTGFRGIKFGAPEAEVRKACGVEDDSVAAYAFLTVQGIRSCEYHFEMGDVSVTGHLEILAGRFAGAWMSFPSDDFSTVREAFVERYGRPVETLQIPVRTKAGVPYKNTTLRWRWAGVTVFLQQFGNTIAEGYASIETSDVDGVRRRADAKNRAAAVKALDAPAAAVTVETRSETGPPILVQPKPTDPPAVQYPKTMPIDAWSDGDAVIKVFVAADGTVESTEVVEAPVGLAEVAEEAVREWNFTPARIGPNIVGAAATVRLRFDRRIGRGYYVQDGLANGAAQTSVPVPEIGMAADEVRALFGEPLDRESVRTGDGDVVDWKYPLRGIIVRFSDSRSESPRVVAVQDDGGHPIANKSTPAESRPEVLTKVEPDYPEVARKARIAGIVIIECTINKAGDVTDVHVLKPLPFGLDQAAMEAVKRWKFKPATRDGQAVDSTYQATVSFALQP